LNLAKDFYLNALNLCEDSVNMVIYLNNLGNNAVKREKIDSAFFYLDKSLQISKQHDNIYLGLILSSIAEGYQKAKQYDSAYYYFKLSLIEAKNNNRPELEAEIISRFGNMFFEINKIDSALYYIDLSNKIAFENNFLKISADNYLTLSKIEESKGNITKSFEYYKTYSNLKDSIFSVDKFSEINQLQRLYEVSKTNQQIESLIIEQQVNERTIYYKNIIWYITLGILILVTFVLFIILYQKKRLNNAYELLVEKNVEIIKNQEETTKKEKKTSKTNDNNDELMNKILSVMKDPVIYCDAFLTVDKIASLTQSNHSYVSNAIKNSSYKNFRKFINSYRIKEAQRIFMDPVIKNYTIEYIAEKVGYKSRSVFYDAFKEITGVSPNYYIKSMQQQQVV
jgi:YesN/AraC family two-component response regulator